MRRRSGRSFLLSASEVVAFLGLSCLVLVGILDLARGLNQFITLNQVAEAGANYASLIPNLERGSFLSNVSTNPRNHVQLQKELSDVLRKLGFDPQRTKISTENMNDNSVRIQISSVFVSRFGLFQPIPMNVSISGPYRKGKGIEI